MRKDSINRRTLSRDKCRAIAMRVCSIKGDQVTRGTRLEHHERVRLIVLTPYAMSMLLRTLYLNAQPLTVITARRKWTRFDPKQHGFRP
jgi:hypothetical protein